MPLTTTWVQLADLWVRADHIIALRATPTTNGAPAGRWATPGQQLVVGVHMPTDTGEPSTLWQTAGHCPADRAEKVTGLFFKALTAAATASMTPSFVYPVQLGGLIDHWAVSSTLPEAHTTNGAVLGLARDQANGA